MQHRNPKYFRPKCDSCEVLVINNTATHEGGCPKSWINPVTNKPYLQECGWCGSSFMPQYRGQEYCEESCAASDRRNPGANMYRYRRNPDEDYSPGNFRRPTLEKCEEYLNWWADQGVTTLSDLNSFDMIPEERALDKIRWSEAKYYWDRYQKQLGRHTTDSYVYRKPLLSVPAEDAEDYGDFEVVSVKAARQYLYNFFTRQTERIEAGLPLQDVEIFPWKPRYDECVAILGQDEVDQIEQKIDERHGLAIYRRNPYDKIQEARRLYQESRSISQIAKMLGVSVTTARKWVLDLIPSRRNPGVCAKCGLANCPCGCNGDPSLCTCLGPLLRRRRNPDLFESLADEALAYAHAREGGRRRNPYYGRGRPSMPW